MSLNKQAIRDDLTSEPGYIHLDNAGASLMPRCVLDTQIKHLELEGSVGGYEAERLENQRIEAVYDSVARLINCHRDEVAIVENASVGWMMAFYSIPFERGDRILTAEAEYASNYLAYLQVARERGVVVETIPSTGSGEVCIDSLRAMIDDRVRLISVTHVPTNGGLVNPVAAIGAVAREHGIFYIVDACQSTGQIVLDVDVIQCDVLTATGRKFIRGPRGVGFLYVRSAVLDTLHPPMIDLFSARWIAADRYELRADARRFENWENNYAARLGLGRAIDYALDIGIEVIEREVTRLAALLRDLLRAVPAVTVQDIGKHKCGIVTFSMAGVEAVEIETYLRNNRILVSVSSPASTLIDANRRQLPVLVRSGVHYFNTEAELEALVATVQRCC
ncbi:MAG TPA: aminotransferase class V-fold PLP-dependent enzyme [Gammaproteobacteria bacterium]|nr:aminotransferase class V-fold PLP-dependent enzyme [Gammaproteobacteria bacterium]